MIEISPILGCNLKKINCDVWTADAVHDIINSQILLSL